MTEPALDTTTDTPPDSSSSTAERNHLAAPNQSDPAPPSNPVEARSPSTSSHAEDEVESTPSDRNDRGPEPSHSTTTPLDPRREVSNSIMGQACPCVVTGASELTGEVELQGDIVVDGGTLVARPGVNVNGNGYQIMFINGGKADFQGTETPTWSDQGSTQNLQRDIEFRNLRRIIWTGGGGQSILRYFTISDSGTSALGDYPLHWHLNGDSTRGTIVEGVVVMNGRHHAYVPHGSHGITFIDTIAKNTLGDAYWWDPAFANCTARWDSDCTLNNSNDITYDHALVDGVTNGPGDDRGLQLAGFRLGAGSGNSVTNSAAINVHPSHTGSCSGFHWPEDANQNAGGNVWRFVDNHAVTDCFGIFVWQNDANHHVVAGFTGSGINHGAYSNKYDYRSMNVANLIIHATGWKMQDSKVDQIVVQPHAAPGSVTLSNVSVRTVIMEDAPAGDADQPITLNITSPDLTCAEVQWTNPHPQSQVAINGTSCGG